MQHTAPLPQNVVLFGSQHKCLNILAPTGPYATKCVSTESYKWAESIYLKMIWMWLMQLPLCTVQNPISATIEKSAQGTWPDDITASPPSVIYHQAQILNLSSMVLSIWLLNNPKKGSDYHECSITAKVHYWTIYGNLIRWSGYIIILKEHILYYIPRLKTLYC